MSTSKQTYVIYGAELDYKKVSANYEKLLDADLMFPRNGVGAKGTCGILFDGMNSKYCIAGYCLGVDSDSESVLLNLDKNKEKKYFDNVVDFFIKNLNNYDKMCDFTFFVVSHWH